MPKDKQNALLLKQQNNYAVMPEDKHNTLLLHSRERYANLAPEQRTIKLRSQHDTHMEKKSEPQKGTRCLHVCA